MPISYGKIRPTACASLPSARWCAPPKKPLPGERVAVLTIEDGIRDGGIGMSIADSLTVPTRVLGIPTKFIPQAKPDAILAQLGLDASGVVRAVCEMMGA